MCLGKGLGKQDFPLDWMFPGKEGNTMIGYVNKSYKEGGKTREMLATTVTQISQDRDIEGHWKVGRRFRI